MDVPRRELATVAARAARAGGDYLAEQFRTGGVDGEYRRDDVKAQADREAERRVLSVVEAAFPTHATHAEETGRSGDSDHVWVIDPLDGTNNFAAGFPAFATAVCCVRDGDPVVAAIYEPLPDSLYVAIRGEGVTVAPAAVAVDPAESGRPIRADSDVALENGTVSYLVGLPAVRDPDRREQSDAIAAALEPACKRVLESWSPCVDWGMLARGASQGVVCFHPDPYEQYAGSLLAEESGAAIDADDDVYVAAPDAACRDRLRELVDGVRE